MNIKALKDKLDKFLAGRQAVIDSAISSLNESKLKASEAFETASLAADEAFNKTMLDLEKEHLDLQNLINDEEAQEAQQIQETSAKVKSVISMDTSKMSEAQIIEYAASIGLTLKAKDSKVVNLQKLNDYLATI